MSSSLGRAPLIVLFAGVLVMTARNDGFANPPFHAQGEMAGEPTATSILLQTRLTATAGPELNERRDLDGAAGHARFEVARDDSFQESQWSEWARADADQDYIVRSRIDALQPATVYFYRVWSGATKEQAQPGPTRQFTTLPASTAATDIAFCMGSCMNYGSFMTGKANGGGPVTATEMDRQRGYPSFASMLVLEPAFFIGTGDIVYYDSPKQETATTLPELRRKWHQQFRFPRMVEFFARTPAYWSKDDHDFRFNDSDLNGSKAPLPQTGIELFREQMPIHPAGDTQSPTYRTHRIGRDLQLWFTEGRDYRSPNKMPDGPGKTLWGEAQKQWLMSSLSESDARWKIIISPTPMVGPDDRSKTDNHANLGGFRHEADAFFDWVKASNIQNLFVFCGDRHWQYHSIHPSGIQEFGCGALNDENSRRGVPPGSERGTDPEGLIVQPYTYPQPTGGFLHVQVRPDASRGSRLTIQFHDDRGQRLYETTF